MGSGPELDAVARWQTRRGERYWFDVPDEEGVVYVAYNSCAEDPARPMVGFLDQVLAAVDRNEA